MFYVYCEFLFFLPQFENNAIAWRKNEASAYEVNACRLPDKYLGKICTDKNTDASNILS